MPVECATSPRESLTSVEEAVVAVGSSMTLPSRGAKRGLAFGRGRFSDLHQREGCCGTLRGPASWLEEVPLVAASPPSSSCERLSSKSS